MASVIFEAAQRENADPYASNWLERLRKIKQLRARLLQETGGAATGGSEDSSDFHGSQQKQRPFSVDDFTEFV